MTQLIVSIDNPSLLDDIKNAIQMIRGVVSVKKPTAQPNSRTIAAIEEIAEGKGIRCKSFDDYRNLVDNLDDV